MYLKCVEIDGFKSFAEKIKLDFNTGITSIVGPNGSGKSNILDAILWVLGEQSYKNIRAKDSKDVIFSGGKNKRARNTATVSLYIDNESQTLDMEDILVKVTRKINSKGENEYYINDDRCRLKDINELFLDTGVGKSAYSVIGQGKVEKIISASNKEIKSIVEEAAGIKKIKLRKEEALKKLTKVELETDKIDLIVNELRENKNKIEKQSEKAIKYKNIDTEKNSLKKSILLEEYNINKNIKVKLEDESCKDKEKLSQLENYFLIKEKSLEDVNQERALLSTVINDLAGKNMNLKKDIDGLINDKVLYSERVKGFNREASSKKTGVTSLEVKIKDQRVELNGIKEKEEATAQELINLESKYLEFENELKGIEESQRDLEIEIGVQKEHIMNSEVDRLKLIAEIENTEKRSKSSLNRINNLLEEGSEYQKNLDKYSKEIKILKDKKNKLELEIKTIDKTIENSEKQIEELSEKMNLIFSERKEISYNLGRHRARLENLKKLEANNEGFFKGVKNILNENIIGVHGALISLIDIPERIETAIESGVGGSLQDIVVQDSSVAKKCISFLKSTNSGRASFLAFDNLKLNKNNRNIQGKGVLGYAYNLIDYEVNFSKAIEFVLGTLLIVEDIDVALRVSKENIHRGNIVTLKGELISGRGKITGGQHIKSASSIIFERKKEIKKIELLVMELDKQHFKLNNDYEKMNSEMESHEKQLENIDDFKEEQEEQVRVLSRLINEIDMNIKKEMKKIKIVELEQQEEQNYIDEYTKQSKGATTQRFNTESVLKNSKKLLVSNNNKLITIKVDKETLNKSYSNIKINYLNKKESIKLLSKESSRNIEYLNSLIKEKDVIVEEIEKITIDIKEISEKLEKIEQNYFNENTRYEKEYIEIKEKRKLQEELEILEKKEILAVKNTEKDIILQENRVKNIIEKFEKVNGYILHLEEELEELLNVKPLDEKITDLKKYKEKLQTLENRLKGLGVVNLLAIEEFMELTEKYTFITSQRDDLIKSKKALLNLVVEIEKTIEIQFYTAYKEININFGYMCREVLNNSVGSLKLKDEDNLIESGIDLVVKFKNKKSQSITLLSGGEKSMVAIAFIMALFMYKPSPFTFFDEIEAALDETNIKKLINKLKEFTD
ncbi:MAG: chromosome segregation protein SMC, partial [Psychrilyobacter sp.]|nr:chromosome segregation protein SMC [Psychrilyobacter sp.]